MLPVADAIIIPEGSIAQGSTVTLNCSAFDGNLPVTYTWTDPNGVIIAHESIFQLRPDMARDYGTYSCTVANSVGSDSATVVVLFPGKS